MRTLTFRKTENTDIRQFSKVGIQRLTNRKTDIREFGVGRSERPKPRMFGIQTIGDPNFEKLNLWTRNFENIVSGIGNSEIRNSKNRKSEDSNVLKPGGAMDNCGIWGGPWDGLGEPIVALDIASPLKKLSTNPLIR